MHANSTTSDHQHRHCGPNDMRAAAGGRQVAHRCHHHHLRRPIQEKQEVLHVTIRYTYVFESLENCCGQSRCYGERAAASRIAPLSTRANTWLVFIHVASLTSAHPRTAAAGACSWASDRKGNWARLNLCFSPVLVYEGFVFPAQQTRFGRRVRFTALRTWRASRTCTGCAISRTLLAFGKRLTELTCNKKMVNLSFQPGSFPRCRVSTLKTACRSKTQPHAAQ